MTAKLPLRALPGGARKAPLYGVDTMLFIYHFEDNPELGGLAGRLLERAEGGEFRLVTSIVTLMEVLVIPKRHGFDSLAQRYREFFSSFPNLQVLPVGPEVAEIAADLRAAHPLRPPDALQVATALHGGAEAFVSEDRRLRRLDAIRVLGIEEALAV